MSSGSQPLDAKRRANILTLASALRPELHRYCARLMGSVIDGEDVVQDTLARAVLALQGLEEPLALRALLADDVRLVQSSNPVRAGSEDVGVFFSTYAKIDGVRLAPAWLEGREVIAVFDGDTAPGYFMWLEWRNDRIVFIRDYRYDRYVAQDAELVLARS